jgi:hypothetical protein
MPHTQRPPYNYQPDALGGTDASGTVSLCATCGQPEHGSCQCWFWTPEWQAAEHEIEADLAAGRFETFDTMDEFLATLSGA